MILSPLLEGLRPGQVVLVFSAHCDDAPIGCGALLRRLADKFGEQCPRQSYVFTGGNDPVRRREEEAASSAFGLCAPKFYDFPDSFLPNHWHEVKEAMHRIREEVGRDRVGLVLCPRLEDRHQDHKVLAENVWRIFRDHLVLEYEIHKYEGDLGQPNVYLRLTEQEAQAKTDLIMASYASRACHTWWSPETFQALMRVRGVEVNAPFAEAYTARKLLI